MLPFQSPKCTLHAIELVQSGSSARIKGYSDSPKDLGSELCHYVKYNQRYCARNIHRSRGAADSTKDSSNDLRGELNFLSSSYFFYCVDWDFFLNISCCCSPHRKSVSSLTDIQIALLR